MLSFKAFLTSAVSLCVLALVACSAGSSGFTSDGITTFLPAPIPFPATIMLGCQPGTLTGVISVRQTGYNGTFTAQSRDLSVATTAAGPGTNQFTVSRASATSGGSTQVYILGGGLQPGIVDINVSGC